MPALGTLKHAKNKFVVTRVENKFLVSTKSAQVVMARGLCSNWKQPIFYNFDTNVTKDILSHIIQQLYRCGYTVLAIVSDMGATNIALWNSLDISVESTSFQHCSDDQKRIFVFADIPNLLKLLLNHFLDSGFTLEGEALTKRAIEQFLGLCGTSDLKIGHKITQHMLDVKHSQTQKVKTAAQLFFRITAKVVQYCGENNLINDASYTALSKFIELTNNLISSV